jgi:hypothetical protein
MEHDIEKSVNMKLILCIFEQLSGLKINFHKSEFFFALVKLKTWNTNINNLVGVSNAEWNPVGNRFASKLRCWRSKMLSYGDRLVLINSVLTSLPTFMLSFLEIPKGVRKHLDFYRSSFFWQSDENSKKYRLSKWNILCRPKDQGGLCDNPKFRGIN